MSLAHQFGPASGPSLDACSALAFRFNAARGFRHDHGESWLLERDARGLHARIAVGGWFTGLWRSPAGRAWVTDVDGNVHVTRGPDPTSGYDTHALPTVLAGVWGTDDTNVWVWGGLGDDTHLFRWDGARWSAVPSPGRVMGMHGPAADFVYAVGADGLIAWWDGGQWRVVPSPARVTLSSVCVASADEMYACGNGRRLLEGTSHGWSEVLAAEGQLLAVAHFGGRAWVAGPEVGLCTLAGQALVPSPAKLRPSRLDARGALLVSCADALYDTADGVTFRRAGVADFEAITRGRPTLWP